MTTLTEVRKTLKENEKFYGSWKDTLQLRDFYTGITPNIHYNTVKKYWKNLPKSVSGNRNFITCYSPYLRTGQKLINKSGWKYHVAYNTMPIWFPEFVEEFNNFFDNIKLEILDIKSSSLYFSERSSSIWGTGEGVKTYVVSLEPNGGKKLKRTVTPIVRFYYNDNYNPTVKFLFNYSVVILVRLLCYGEKFHHPLVRKPRNMMKYLVELNNSNRGYRSFSEKDTSLEQLKLLDDTELVNSNVDKVFYKKNGRFVITKQTDFINKITGGNYVKKSNFAEQVKRIEEQEARKKEMAEKKAQDTGIQTPKPLKPVPGCLCAFCRKARKKLELEKTRSK
jgi:hypothetical protein